MIEKMTAKASKYGLEIYWFIQYKRLKRTKNTKIRRLEKEKEEVIQQLASARFEEEIAKTREKLARKQIRQLKEVIKDQKEAENEGNSNNKK